MIPCTSGARTGRGGTASVTRAEIGLSTLGELLLQESLAPGTVGPVGNSGGADAPQNLFACAGDDEWCVVEVRGDDEWQRLCAVIDRPDIAADPSLATATGRWQDRAGGGDRRPLVRTAVAAYRDDRASA